MDHYMPIGPGSTPHAVPPMHSVPKRATVPRLGLLAGLRRLLLGDRIKRAQVSDHGAFMRSIGRAWAIPMTLVFSSGALITLGQKQLGEIVAALQHHQAPNYVTVALLLITFVIVGGMDLTLLNSAVELRDARLRGVDPRSDPYTKGARLRVWLVSLIESATFMSVAYQLDQPPSLAQDWVGCLVAWAFMGARRLGAPASGWSLARSANGRWCAARCMAISCSPLAAPSSRSSRTCSLRPTSASSSRSGGCRCSSTGRVGHAPMRRWIA